MVPLCEKLETLCIFRDLLEDPVISALHRYLETPQPSLYAAFVSALYKAGGDLGAHVKTLCENSENVYVKAVGAGKAILPYMDQTLSAELCVLQEISELTREMLCCDLKSAGFLPAFGATTQDLASFYRHRLENIGKFGFGVYANNPMFFVDEKGSIVPVAHPDPIQLSQLVDYKREQQIVLENTKALLASRPAANVLLTGDAGTGKSSTVKAVANALWQEGLRIVELRKDQLRVIPKLLSSLSGNPLKFVLFIDDLSFLKDDDNFNALKAVLEGSVTAKSKNVVIYATSNRRHIIRESLSEREGDEVHRNDAMQEQLSLSERFGIHVSFSRPSKETYLRIVHTLACDLGVQMPENEMDLLAERFALERGGRSARLARQFVDGLLSRNP